MERTKQLSKSYSQYFVSIQRVRLCHGSYHCARSLKTIKQEMFVLSFKAYFHGLCFWDILTIVCRGNFHSRKTKQRVHNLNLKAHVVPNKAQQAVPRIFCRYVYLFYRTKHSGEGCSSSFESQIPMTKSQIDCILQKHFSALFVAFC